MRWPWSREVSSPPTALSLQDPALATWLFGGGTSDLAGVVVGERSALGISALYRAISLISGTLASLSLNTWTGAEDQRKQVPSVFDNPGTDDGQTAYEWKETLFIHLLLHGRAGALKQKTEAGGLAGLPLVHPLCFRTVLPSQDEYAGGRLPVGGLWFDINMADGTQYRTDATDFWYVPGQSLDGKVGVGLLDLACQSLGTTIAGDRAAARSFSSGAMISGLATPSGDEDITEDVPEIRRQLDRSVSGWENAGGIAVINRPLNLQPWTMTAVQAQFLESRQFQIEEIARWTGVPPHLLMQTDKQTSWGTGVDEQNRGLSKFVLGHWATRVEQRASRLLARPRWVEFDFASLERPNFQVEIDLLIKQVQAGLLTVNEARAIRNLPPLPEPAQEPATEPAQDGETDAPTE